MSRIAAVVVIAFIALGLFVSVAQAKTVASHQRNAFSQRD